MKTHNEFLKEVREELKQPGLRERVYNPLHKNENRWLDRSVVKEKYQESKECKK